MNLYYKKPLYNRIHSYSNNIDTRQVSLKSSDLYPILFKVLNLTELLKRGIGIHHSGILPILKVKSYSIYFSIKQTYAKKRS